MRHFKGARHIEVAEYDFDCRVLGENKAPPWQLKPLNRLTLSWTGEFVLERHVESSSDSEDQKWIPTPDNNLHNWVGYMAHFPNSGNIQDWTGDRVLKHENT